MQLTAITIADIDMRIERLKQLALGFGRERLFWPKGNDRLMFDERDPYLNAIGDAESACEAARVALAKAKHRLEAEEQAREGRKPI